MAQVGPTAWPHGSADPAGLDPSATAGPACYDSAVLWLFLIFVVLPMVDLVLLLGIGEVLGFWPTLGITVAVAALGGYLGKREGLKVLRQWRDAMASLRMPEEGLVSAALVLAGAVLLAAPGVLTDVVGLALLVPYTRKPIARLVRRALEGRMQRAVQSGNLRVNVVTSVSARVSAQGDGAWEPAAVRRDPGIEVIDVDAEVVPEEPKALPAKGESSG